MSGQDAIQAVCDEAAICMPVGWDSYFELVRSWAARTDLTSATIDHELAEVLFLDAARAIGAGWIQTPSSVIDVGAGVGAPTLPLLLSSQGLVGTLVEPRRIRAAFLRTAIGGLHLEDRATVLERRVDPTKPSVEGTPFDIALSRATFTPDDWLRIGAELAHEVWVLTAGTDVSTPTGLHIARRLDYEVPSSGAPRSILAFQH
jgi:16S rRNA (guanine527-N7)-methyltransferase